MLSDNEYVEFEDRKYLNPQVALGESDAFIDNLRSTQQANNQQIQTDTYNLGTEIPSDLGGLTGGEGYFAARYSTPQTASAVSNLRAAAQATALNQVLADEQAKWKNRYQQAYRDYQKRQYDASKTPQNPSKTTPDTITQEITTREIGDVETEGIMKNMFNTKFEEYIKQGLSAPEAEIKAKQAIGGSADTSEGLEKKRAYVRGRDKEDYIYTLPNGNTVLVPEGTKLVNAGEDYFIQNLETGELIKVGK